MLLDPVLIKCPHCSTLSQHYQLMSYTIHKAEYWSDGKCDSFDIHKPSLLIKCRTCNQFYWIDKNNNQISRRIDHEAHEKLGNQEFPNLEINEEVEDIENLNDAIVNGLGNTNERETYLRTRLWQKINDLLRYNKGKSIKLLEFIRIRKKFPVNNRNKKTYEDNAEKFKENLMALAALMDDTYIEDLITKAEIYREIGIFNKSLTYAELCKNHPDFKSSEGIKTTVKKIIRYAKRKKSAVFKI